MIIARLKCMPLDHDELVIFTRKVDKELIDKGIIKNRYGDDEFNEIEL
jgi:hypothetical protein